MNDATVFAEYRVSVCQDCIYADANGGTEETVAPTPLNRVKAGEFITPDESDHFCEGHFSWSECATCGQTLGGTRYCYLWLIPIGEPSGTTDQTVSTVETTN